VQVYGAALAALGFVAGAQGAVGAAAGAPMTAIHFQFAAADHDGASQSLIDSNRSALPLEAWEPKRFLDVEEANFDEAIPGNVLGHFSGLDELPENQPMMNAPINAATEEELDRFSLAGAGSLPEIGIDEDDIEPGDVVLVVGGMGAIGALIFRLRKGAKLPKFPKMTWRSGRKKRPTMMSDSDFYPI
jgi:hypothetical protein